MAEAPDPAGTPSGSRSSAEQRGHRFLGTAVPRVGVFPAGCQRVASPGLAGLGTGLARLGGAGGPRGQPPRLQPQAAGPASGAEVEAVDARALGPGVFGVEGDVRVCRGPGGAALGRGPPAHRGGWQGALGAGGQPRDRAGHAGWQQEPATFCPGGSGHPGGGTKLGAVRPGQWHGAFVGGRGAAQAPRRAAGSLQGQGSGALQPQRPRGLGQAGGAGGDGGEGPGALRPRSFGRGAFPPGSVDDVPGEPRLHLPAGPGVGVLPQRGRGPLAPRRGHGGSLIQLGHRGRAGPAVQAARSPRRPGGPGGRGGEGRPLILEGDREPVSAQGDEGDRAEGQGQDWCRGKLCAGSAPQELGVQPRALHPLQGLPKNAFASAPLRQPRRLGQAEPAIYRPCPKYDPGPLTTCSFPKPPSGCWTETPLRRPGGPSPRSGSRAGRKEKSQV